MHGQVSFNKKGRKKAKTFVKELQKFLIILVEFDNNLNKSDLDFRIDIKSFGFLKTQRITRLIRKSIGLISLKEIKPMLFLIKEDIVFENVLESLKQLNSLYPFFNVLAFIYNGYLINVCKRGWELKENLQDKQKFLLKLILFHMNFAIGENLRNFWNLKFFIPLKIEDLQKESIKIMLKNIEEELIKNFESVEQIQNSLLKLTFKLCEELKSSKKEGWQLV